MKLKNISLLLFGLIITTVVSCGDKRSDSNDIDIEDSKNIEENSQRVFVRDFSNGTFSENEVLFISNYFKSKFTKNKSYSEPTIELGQSEIRIETCDENDYCPMIYFSKTYNNSLAGDLDGDGIYEIIFTVTETAGGTAEWDELYCLKISQNGYFLFRLNTPVCPCKNNYECRDKSVDIIKVEKDILTLQYQCFTEDDADCCASSSTDLNVRFNEVHLNIIRY